MSSFLTSLTVIARTPGHPHRAARDVDLLGVSDPSEDRIPELFAEMIALEVADDGVVFDVGSLAVGPIRDEREYGRVDRHQWKRRCHGAATTRGIRRDRLVRRGMRTLE
jgi:hypothetical protein